MALMAIPLSSHLSFPPRPGSFPLLPNTGEGAGSGLLSVGHLPGLWGGHFLGVFWCEDSWEAHSWEGLASHLPPHCSRVVSELRKRERRLQDEGLHLGGGRGQRVSQVPCGSSVAFSWVSHWQMALNI